MILTNNYNLPEPLVHAIKATIKPPKEKILHVTELINPPQIAYLKRRNWEFLTADVSEYIWAFFGTVAHAALAKEEVSETGHQEKNMLMDLGDGFVLSGTADLWEDGVLTDYKFTSVWSYILSDKPEWTAQVNVYAELFRMNSVAVEAAQIIAFLKDWKERDAELKEDYPLRPVLKIDIPLWSREEVQSFIRSRAETLKLSLMNDIIRECTPEERWSKKDIWAVKKAGQKRAVSGGLQDSEEGAKDLIQLLTDIQGGKYEVEFRKGEETRCERYCLVRDFCDQFKAIQQKIFRC